VAKVALPLDSSGRMVRNGKHKVDINSIIVGYILYCSFIRYDLTLLRLLSYLDAGCLDFVCLSLILIFCGDYCI